MGGLLNAGGTTQPRGSERPTGDRRAKARLCKDLIGKLVVRHRRLLRQRTLVTYAIDMRDALSMPDSVAREPEPTDAAELALTDLREQVLQTMDAMLASAHPRSPLANTRPAGNGWWISLSEDGQLPVHVLQRLHALKAYKNIAEDRLPDPVRAEIADLGYLLDDCERILALTRACVAAFDFQAALNGLLECERSMGP